ncbi:MAG TPA: ABC transporter permease, partial [Bradyrhizobium sp.]
MTDAVADASLRTPGSPPAATVRVRSYWGSVWQRLRYDYVTLFCLALIILIVLSALFAPWLSPMDPYKSSMAHRLRPIGFRNYLLGTDEQGRDILSRILYGGRVSLTMGMLPVALATIIGGLFGVVAGYFGGKINMVIMRTMDVFFAFPSVLLAVAISGSLGGGITNQLLTLTVVLIPPLCRVAETATS